jgi:hypothetical protein
VGGSGASLARRAASAAATPAATAAGAGAGAPATPRPSAPGGYFPGVTVCCSSGSAVVANAVIVLGSYSASMRCGVATAKTLARASKHATASPRTGMRAPATGARARKSHIFQLPSRDVVKKASSAGDMAMLVTKSAWPSKARTMRFSCSEWYDTRPCAGPARAAACSTASGWCVCVTSRHPVSRTCTSACTPPPDAPLYSRSDASLCDDTR